MSLSTRRPAGGGLPSSVRIPRSPSSVRDQEARPRTRDNPHPPSSSDNRFRSQRSRSVPRKESDDPYRLGRAYDTPPVPSTASRHSVQSSVSSSSSGASSAVSAASTAPSSLWDYAGWKGTSAGSTQGSEEQVSAGSHTDNSNTLWSRVTAAAGGLSINVGKAWEAKDDLPEPDTPPGRDSRVTVALKKHYISQVSDPRQLPAWLFSDVERQVGRSTRRADLPPDTSVDGPPHAAPAPPRLRARHNDAYSQPQIAPTRERTQAVTHDEEYKGPTRAATRLRAMRDARRGPVVDRGVHAPAVAVSEPEPEPVVVAVPPRPRVGLPSRPTRPRRE